MTWSWIIILQNNYNEKIAYQSKKILSDNVRDVLMYINFTSDAFVIFWKYKLLFASGNKLGVSESKLANCVWPSSLTR